MTLTTLPQWEELLALRRPLTACERLIIQMVGSIASTTRQEPSLVYEQQRRLARQEQARPPKIILNAATIDRLASKWRVAQ